MCPRGLQRTGVWPGPNRRVRRQRDILVARAVKDETDYYFNVKSLLLLGDFQYWLAPGVTGMPTMAFSYSEVPDSI